MKAPSRTAAVSAASLGVLATPLALQAQQAPAGQTGMDTPVSMTVISGASLESNHETRLEEWAGDAGLVLVQESQVYNLPVIRGISLGLSSVNPPVKTYLDDIPLLSVGLYQNAGIAGNFDTFDMENITVLKGPEGTEFGANALGGVIQYLTRAPDPTAFASSLEAGGSEVVGNTGYSTHATVNIPIGDAAVRVTAFDTYYPGFIDDPSRGLSNINGEHVSGGRASVLWAPSDTVTIRLTAMLQQTLAGDTEDIDYNQSGSPTYGRYEVEQATSSPLQERDEAFNATIKWDAGAVSVLSSTSFVYIPASAISDESSLYGAVFPSYGGAAVLETQPASDLTQELRFTSRQGGRFSWQAGVYYDHDYGQNNQYLVPVDLATRQVIYEPPAEQYPTESSYLGRAVFGSIDYFLVPRVLDIVAGARYSEDHQSYSQIMGGTLLEPGAFLVRSNDHSTTGSTDLRWQPLARLMAYARVASGYSPGGPNADQPGSTAYAQYGPSTTVNYEIGAKAEAPAGHVTATVALYDINWRHIQIFNDAPAVSAITNEGAAVSSGLEWDIGYVPAEGLTLGINGAYTDAHLTKDLAPAEGADAGDALPYTPRFATNVSGEYRRVISSELTAFAGEELRLTQARPADFALYGGPRVTLPRTHVLDLKAGLQAGGVTVTLYVHNLTDQVVFTSLASEGNTAPQLATTLPPRTVGVSVAERF